MKKILLTGSTGFLGSHLLLNLINQGFDVVILKRSTSNVWRIKDLLSKVTVFNIDEIDLQIILEQEKPEVIIHTACNYGRDNNNILDIINTNLIFGIQLIEEGVKNGVKTFVNTGSLLTKNLNEYSLSKGQFEEWLKLYSKKIQVINLRIEHMFGPNDDIRKFFPWIINEIFNNKGDIKLTSGTQKRDFIHVYNVVEAIALVLNKRKTLTNYNEFDVGTNNFTSVKDVILKIVKFLDESEKNNTLRRLKFGEISYREKDLMIPRLNNSKLIELGWIPFDNLDELIKEYVLIEKNNYL